MGDDGSCLTCVFMFARAWATCMIVSFETRRFHLRRLLQTPLSCTCWSPEK